MNTRLSVTTGSHVVDILGNVIGRDQPIMLMAKAVELVSCLGEDLLTNDEVVFFDPFCKAGEILLACALVRCLAKVNKHKKMIDVKTIQEELYGSNRYFALAPDERHHRLSLRTFLGNTNSHDEKLTRIIRDGHYLSEIDGRLDKDKFEKEFNDMLEYITTTSKKKKIIVVGNPPYQESDGGFGKSAKNIYQHFAQTLIIDHRILEFVLVIPARWFAGGKGLDDFRTTLMTTNHLVNLRYFNKASSIFPTVDINGGICFIHYDKTHSGPTNFSDENYNVSTHLNEFDIIPDDPMAISIVRKIKSIWNGIFVDTTAWPRKPFGLGTNYFDINKDLNGHSCNVIPCLSKGRQIKYVSKDKITKNHDKVNMWKVCVPKAVGGAKGKRRSTVPLNQIFIVEPGTITTETYNVIDVFKTKEKALKFANFLKTNFSRYLVGLRKITQDLPPDRWGWVPYMNMSDSWTDVLLFKYFNITKNEQQHIKKKLEEWS